MSESYNPRLELQNRRNAIAKIEQSVNSMASPVTSGAAVFREGAIMWLALGRGWLGKALGTLGDAYPYPESLNPTNDTIEPPAYNRLERHPTFSNTISAIKQARVDIEALGAIDDRLFAAGKERIYRCIALSGTALDNAKMMLGEELGAIYEFNKHETAVA